MARRIRKKKGRARSPSPLPLTSMMDILTVLLLFLLKSFVVEGEVITPVPGVDLPKSTSEDLPEATVVVAIFDNTVMLDGQMVVKVEGADPAGDLLIPRLAERLGQARARKAEIARLRGEEADDQTRIAIQGDQD